MSTTFKSAFRKDYNSPEREHINLNDCLADSEFAAIRFAKLAVNGNGGPPGFCFCSELLVNGRRVPCPAHHDCEYVAARSALVLDAESAALKMPGDFTRNFVAQMERLAKPLFNGVNGEAHPIAAK